MTDLINQITDQACREMKEAVSAFKDKLLKVRTGRAHPSLLETIRVVHYEKETTLNCLATITAKDARNLMVIPWDKSATQSIEKAIQQSNLGLNPVSTGEVIRVPLPVLTEERRSDMKKLVKKEQEAACISIRTHRKYANDKLKELTKKKRITEDEERCAKEVIQKMTDHIISEVEKIAKNKEKDLAQI